MSDPSKLERVPFHMADIDRPSRVTLHKGIAYDMTDGRRVEAWMVKEHGGLCVRIYRPTNDGKLCELVFGLKPEAAIALLTALSHHREAMESELSATKQGRDSHI